MLSPKRTKFRKMHKGRNAGLAKGGTDLNFGSFGLKATTPERVTARQIEAVSKKPTEVRMGKGKGSVEFWAAKVKPGRVMFEIDGVDEVTAREALRLAAMKLPVKWRIVQREDW